MKTTTTTGADGDDGRVEPTYPTRYPKVFWVGLALGWPLMAVGLGGLLVNRESPMPTNPPGWATTLLLSNLVHDFVLLPVVFLVGRLVAHAVPARVRSLVQGGLICTGIVSLFAFPFVRDYGRQPDNPTILPQNALRGWVLVLAMVWATTAAVGVVQSIRRRRVMSRAFQR